MAKAKEYDELNISQLPAIELLEKLGYIHLSAAAVTGQRGNLYQVLLKDVLRRQLEKLNGFTYKKNSYKFSEKNIRQAMQDIDEALTDGLIKTNEKIYDSLMFGRSYQENLPDGTKRSFNLKLIDWETPENNLFHVVDEFAVEREDGQGTARPDIVLFVNGIPLAVIECKKASIGMKQGISQMLRNQGKNYIPQLFKFTQLLMATNKNETMYATCGTPEKFWSVWKEEEREWLTSITENYVQDRLVTRQDENIISLFKPGRLLDMIQFFTLFDNTIKKIARYQQFFAVREIIKTIQEKDKQGNRQSGVIWHTQGSGKSLTMVMVARYILSRMPKCQPKVLVVTDRIELDKQIHRTFNHTRLKAYRATTGRNLIDLIHSNKADVITTLVHKFDTAAENQEPIDSKDIFILVDESHRTQYGELHLKMKKVFPNACYLGFTGTPLMKNEKNTMIKFGKIIHKYTITDGVRDKAIVPLLYEGKMVEQSVNQKAIDNQLAIISRNLNDKQKEEVKQKWSQFERIASSDQRLKLIAFDINEHFRNHYKIKGTQFKAMLATNSKVEAVRYLEALEELDDLAVRVVISAPDQREGYSTVDEESKNKVIKFWNRMLEKYGSPDAYEDAVKDDFVNGDEIDLLIVVDKLLTGFDAPRATVLYIDKPLKEHTLLQAIARVNRLYEGKDYGLIMDYRGLLGKLDEALGMYSGAGGLERFDPQDLKGTIYDVISIIGTLRHYHSNIIELFSPVKNKQDSEEYEVLLADDEQRELFYEHLCGFGKHLAISLESEQVYRALKPEELNQYKVDMKFWQELRKSVKLRYSDSIDYKEYEGRMQKLMDQYIAAEEVIRITNPVDILDEKNFEEELTRLGSNRAKADAIMTRMSKRIDAKWEENPAFYKKFSQQIEETLQKYKDKRISEVEYLKSMTEIMQNFRRGYSGVEYPDSISKNPHAQAFYGVVCEEAAAYCTDNNKADILASLAMDIDIIIDKHSKVDWHDNTEVHNKIAQEIDDLIYIYKNKHELDLSYDQIDKIIENVKTVALRRY